MEEKRFLKADDVARCMEISVPMAYKIIRKLNDELSAKGYWNWYPRVKYTPFMPIVIFFHLVYVALCFTPLAMDIYADYRWKKTQEEGTL